MKAKTIVTVVLLAFVVVSVAYLALNMNGSQAIPPQGAPSAMPGSTTAHAETAGTMAVSGLDTAQPQAAALPASAGGENVADDSAKADNVPEPPEHQVLAYYLHTNTRCPSCIKIEKYTTEAISTGFKKELQSGALVFSVLNTDEKGNEHFVKDYELVTKSVIIADMHKGEQTRWENLEKVWDLLGDEKAFVKYIQDNVRGYLDETK